MATATSGTITATATTNGASTTLMYDGSATLTQLTLGMSSVTGATVVLFTVYDNNVATSATSAGGATWSGKSPGYSGQGPNTARYVTDDYMSARYGDQQGQTAPNTAGVKQYWKVTTATGDLDFAAAPQTRTTATIDADGTGSFEEINATSATGNVVAAVTAARAIYSTTLTAGTYTSWVPTDPIAVSFGLDVVTSATSATAIAGTYTLMYVANVAP